MDMKIEHGQVHSELPTLYSKACRFALRGQFSEARRYYLELETTVATQLKSIISNDLAVLAAIIVDLDCSRLAFDKFLSGNAGCEPARLNAAFLEVECLGDRLGLVYANPVSLTTSLAPVRVAILSFLFNWPSTGGGIVHTVELAEFLARAGYEIRHFHPLLSDWGIGRIADPLPIDSEAIDFNVSFRQACKF